MEGQMKLLKNIARVALIIMSIFLSLTAIAGGIALVARINAPNTAELNNSIFGGTTVPGLALAVLVGGGALLATILLLRRNKFATVSAAAAAVMIMFFEFVEVQAIGSPAGVAKALQWLYFGLGTAMSVVAGGTWFLDLI